MRAHRDLEGGTCNRTPPVHAHPSTRLQLLDASPSTTGHRYLHQHFCIAGLWIYICINQTNDTHLRNRSSSALPPSRTTSTCTTTPGYERTYFFSMARHRHFVTRRDAFQRRIIVDMPLQCYRRHFIAKVFINVVFTNIFINTPPPPRPQDGHLASSDRLFCKTRPRRRQ